MVNWTIEEANDALASLMTKYPDAEYRELADMMNDHFDTSWWDSERVRGRKRQMQGYKPPETIEENRKETIEYNNGCYTFTKIIELIEGEDVTPDMMIKAHGLKVGMWEIVGYKNNFWQAQKKGGKKIVLYQSKLSVKPLKQGIDAEKIASYFKDYKHTLTEPKKIKTGSKMIEINIADIHINKLAWRGNTPENYDLKIAKQMFNDIIADITYRIKDLDIDHILFVWSNDFFNSDTADNKTSAGTPQSNSTIWEKAFTTGVELLINAVETLAAIAPVKVPYHRSNHDEMTGFFAANCLLHRFWGRSDIEVDICAKPRKYYAFGNVLLGLGHGDTERGNGTKEKASKLASTMPVEAAELWKDNQYREIHVGHLHSEQMIQEINGVIVRRIASPTATDSWHNKAGYIGSVRKAQTFVYDREFGLLDILNTPVK